MPGGERRGFQRVLVRHGPWMRWAKTCMSGSWSSAQVHAAQRGTYQQFPDAVVRPSAPMAEPPRPWLASKPAMAKEQLRGPQVPELLARPRRPKVQVSMPQAPCDEVAFAEPLCGEWPPNESESTSTASDAWRFEWSSDKPRTPHISWRLRVG